MMRYFQKLIRRADIDIAYSEGFNPHQKMSFASPLGVGALSESEYVDIEVNTTLTSNEAIEKLNAANVEGIEVLSYRLLNDNAGNAMASVAATDYLLMFRDGYELIDIDLAVKFHEFMTNSDEINVIKQTKKSQVEVNIKPYIFEYKIMENSIFLKLSSGSVTNIKPELVMESFYNYLEKELKDFTFIITRLEVYGNSSEDDKFIPLEDFGEDIL